MSNCLDVLKQAILFERKGYAFYKQVADQAKGKAVKEFFTHMANEELDHVEILSKQFKSFSKSEKFIAEDFSKYESSHSPSVTILNSLKEEVESVSYEAAAISAAMNMEKNAIELYSKRAGETTDEEERKLYSWLVNFEQGHLDDLVAIDNEIQEKIWYDNSFWPM